MSESKIKKVFVLRNGNKRYPDVKKYLLDIPVKYAQTLELKDKERTVKVIFENDIISFEKYTEGDFTRDKEHRILEVNIRSAGGTASKSSKKYQLTIPNEWGKALNFIEEDRTVEVVLDEKIISIKKISLDKE